MSFERSCDNEAWSNDCQKIMYVITEINYILKVSYCIYLLYFRIRIPLSFSEHVFFFRNAYNNTYKNTLPKLVILQFAIQGDWQG